MNPPRSSQTYPTIVFVGVHMEARDPFQDLISSGEAVRALVTLAPEHAAKVSGAVDLTTAAAAAGIPILKVRNVNDPESAAWIRSRQPDVVLVVGWTQLLRTEVLEIPKLACLGFHASLLPKYRGRAPVNWAIIHGETETGNTMIVLEPGADEGDIVAQRRVPILDEDDCGTVYQRIAQTEVEMLREVLPLIRSGILPRRRQEPGQATVMPKRRPEDGKIDWTRPARGVYDWIRALTHPYPGAFTFAGSKKLWVWKARAASGSPRAAGRPGEVVWDAEGWPAVATGDGWLRLISIETEGETEITGKEAVGLLKPGMVLGDSGGHE